MTSEHVVAQFFQQLNDLCGCHHGGAASRYGELKIDFHMCGASLRLRPTSLRGAVQLLAWQLILGSTKSEVFDLDSVARSQQILTNAGTLKPDCWTFDLLGPQPAIKGIHCGVSDRVDLRPKHLPRERT